MSSLKLWALEVSVGFFLSVSLAPAADSLKQVCGDVLSGSAPKAGAVNLLDTQAFSNTQKREYCQAAKSAEQAASADGITWKVWAGVSAVCTVACIHSFVNPFAKYMCTVAGIAGGATDALTTKNYASALMGIGTTAGLQFATKAINQGAADAAKGEVVSIKDGIATLKDGRMVPADQVAKAAPSRDWSACISAATAGLQAATKKKAQSSQLQTAKQNLASAKQMDQGQGLAAGNGTAGDFSSDCQKAQASGNTSAQLACATSTDPSLPRSVLDPQFADAFKKASGIGLGDYLQKDPSSAGQAIGASTSAQLGSDQALQVAKATDEAAAQLNAEDGSSTYAGGGGGGKSKGDSSPDFNQFMNQMMGQINGGGSQGGPQDKNGVGQVAYAYQNRSSDDIAHDTKLPLFDRVQYRYSKLSNRLENGPSERTLPATSRMPAGAGFGNSRAY